MKKRSTIIIGVLAIIVFIAVIIFAAKLVFYSSDDKGVYGNRLDGIENYTISDTKIEEVKNVALKNKECKSISYKLQGKIMKFFVDVVSDTNITTAQRIGDNIIDAFSETELSFYDVIIYVNSENNVEPYPMIGAKNKTETAISWTVNKGEENDEK